MPLQSQDGQFCHLLLDLQSVLLKGIAHLFSFIIHICIYKIRFSTHSFACIDNTVHTLKNSNGLLTALRSEKKSAQLYI